MATREAKSFCRICLTHCGVILTIDDAGRLVGVRGDRDDSQTLGYVCFRGLKAPETHSAPSRLLHPLKRQPDGSFQRIALEQALDEIATKTAAIVERAGPEAVAGFRGSQGVITSSAILMLPALLRALGTPKFFTTATIDQTAKFVAAGRIGIWPAGHVPFSQADVVMLFGANPLVSVQSNGIDFRNPNKRLRDARARGLKLIVIDPRRTETAQHADLFLQVRPGEDATLAAGMLRMILAEGWQDEEFCRRHVEQVPELRQAVESFTPEYVERRADVPQRLLREATQLWARTGRRGIAASGTGANMGPHSNLVEHLIECMNVVCGRFLREGERVPNPGVLAPRWPRKAQVIPAPRWWEQGYRSRIGGFGMLDGEMMTGILADEILEPGPGQVRALFNDGSGIVNAVPGQRRIAEALGSLELLVTIDPFLTPTARLSHYVLPPKMHYERPDLPMFQYEWFIYPEPFTRFTPAMVPVPPGSELVDDWYVFWSLAKRLGLQLDYDGVALDMRRPPSTEDLLGIIARRAPVPLEEIRRHENGLAFPGIVQHVEPAEPDATGRFTVMPPDVVQEIASVAAEPIERYSQLADGRPASHRLIVRRNRTLYNSTGRHVDAIHERAPHNLAYLHPQDLEYHAICAGDRIEITSDFGRIEVVAAADPSVKPGAVSISHGYGGLPDDPADFARDGACVNLLTSGDRFRETINAMPWMTAIPVDVRRIRAPGPLPSEGASA